jgi:hypothetical protein
MTTKQKINACTFMIRYYKFSSYPTKGMCILLFYEFGLKSAIVLTDTNVTQVCEREFPELFRHKPETMCDNLWFRMDAEGVQKRIEILKAVKDELKNSHKMTTQEKINACDYMIEYYQGGKRNDGMCWMLFYDCGMHTYRTESDRFTSDIGKRVFPELFVYEPAGIDRDGLWFPLTENGIQKRIEILKAVKNKLINNGKET